MGDVLTGTTVLGIRVTAEERAQIEDAARAAGQTPAQWVKARALVMSAPTSSMPVVEWRRPVVRQEVRSFTKDAQVAKAPRGSR